MSILNSIVFDEICHRRAIRAADVNRLRALFLANDKITDREICALLTIYATCPVQDTSWPEFLVEAVTDYFVRDLEPVGYLTAANAALLTAMLTDGGGLKHLVAVDILRTVIEEARWVPVSLCLFVLEEIRRAVATGKGPLRTGSGVTPGRITAGDAMLAAGVMTAFAPNEPLAVTTGELEIILRIDAGRAAVAAPVEWEQVVTAAVASAVLAASGYGGVGRAAVFAILNSVNERNTEASERIKELAALYSRCSDEERALHELERQRIAIVTGEAVPLADEADLAALLTRHGPRARKVVALLGQSGFELATELDALTRGSVVAA